MPLLVLFHCSTKQQCFLISKKWASSFQTSSFQQIPQSSWLKGTFKKTYFTLFSPVLDFNILPYVLVESATMDAFAMEQPITSSSARMPQSPRRLTHQLPPRLNIHPTASSELGPPAQAQVSDSLKTLKSFHAAAFHFLFDLNRTMHIHLHCWQCAPCWL